MTSMSNLGNVLCASQAAHRKPVAISITGGFWNSSVAELQLNMMGHGSPVDGDCVSVWSASFSETRWYLGGKWLTIEDYIQPESELCANCGGLGIKHVPFITGPITCPDCSGTGKAHESKTDVRPGLGDEIKPELMRKKLRDWT